MTEENTLDRLKKDAKEMFERLKTERDELRLQSHLLKAELADEWQEVESKLHRMEQNLEQMLSESKETASDIGDSIESVGEEIAEVFRRLRKH